MLTLGTDLSITTKDIRALKNRLLLENYIRENPQITRVEIQKPIFIVGWPRTGTTILHNLMAQDPTHRVAKLWEVLNPAPAPDSAKLSPDPRIEATREGLRMWFEMEPSLHAIHEMSAEAPDECCHLFEQSFIDRHFPVIGQSQDKYSDWLFTRTKEQMIAYYTYYKRQIQILTSDSQQVWVLKDPIHMFFLDSLLAVFPDARVICTHRSPSQVVASCCSGFRTLSRFYYASQDIATKALGLRVLRTLREAAERTMRVRGTLGENEEQIFFDVSYRNFMTDPMGTLQGIYQHCGKSLDPTVAKAMSDYLHDNFQGKKGKHFYSLDEFEISKEQLKDNFGDYCDRFHLPLTPAEESPS